MIICYFKQLKHLQLSTERTSICPRTESICGYTDKMFTLTAWLYAARCPLRRPMSGHSSLPCMHSAVFSKYQFYTSLRCLDTAAGRNLNGYQCRVLLRAQANLPVRARHAWLIRSHVRTTSPPHTTRDLCTLTNVKPLDWLNRKSISFFLIFIKTRVYACLCVCVCVCERFF